ncbi:protoporphyrinogen/coproporphyrinogen oxidase [Subtercola boreus]|uniref:protoporphyrinogen/coproporphyrinogen oxidase n=1 Tax=Subtercola boreus TaxID=120213 RepID=UPI000E2A2394|nr:FAD-dependent oxidoreductase [Subtercola boreus]
MPAGQSVVIVGAGVAGLVAARTLARKGFRVTVLESSATPGGCVATHEVAGVRLDAGAESFATRGGTVAAHLAELGLGGEIVVPNPKGAWVQLEGDAAPLPRNTVLGIPGVPLADEVRRIVGWSGVLRAQLDRYIPLVRVGKSKSLGDLVRRRMGQKVLDRLVAPIVSGVHSAHPDLVDVEAVAPGLLAAMGVQGSLSGAVMSLIARRGTATAGGGRPAAAPADAASGPGVAGVAGAKAGSAVGGIDGGMFRLVEALVADCVRFGVDLRFGVGVRELRRVDMSHARAAPTDAPTEPTDGPTMLHDEAPGADSVPSSVESGGVSRGEASAEWMTVLDDGSVLGSHGVIVAAGFRAALTLLHGIDGIDGINGINGVDGLSGTAELSGTTELSGTAGLREQTSSQRWPGSSAVTLATLVLDAPELDRAPRGTGVLVAEDVTSVGAKALTHATAKWGWLAAAAGEGRHVVRLSYGRGAPATSAPATSAPATSESRTQPQQPQPQPQQPQAPVVTRAQALRDASTLLGVPLADSQVRGFALVEWRDSLAFATGGHRARVDAVVEAVHEHPGLEVVGAWISGTGLAYVIDGAKVKASELAASLLSS